MTPQVAYMQTLGLETMEVRFARQAETCLKLAQCLQELPEIESVNYTGLESNPFYELSTCQFGSLPGAMLTFDLPSREICFRFINRLRIIRRATNLFDNKTLAIHPAKYNLRFVLPRISVEVWMSARKPFAFRWGWSGLMTCWTISYRP